MMGFVKKDWLYISLVWAIVSVGAVLAITVLDKNDAIRAFGVLAAGALALVSLVNLFTSHAEGIVTRLILTAGGSYAILAVAGLYIFITP
jgi:predicted membrane channel-forming protein YqfA (hemolysin III family)